MIDRDSTELHGDALRETRQRLRVPQRLLAEAAGITVQAVSRWELRLTRPTSEHARAVSDFLRVQTKHLRRARKAAASILRGCESATATEATST